MKKVIYLSIFLFFSLALAGCSGDNKEIEGTADDSKLIFFYGIGCPHCENVEAFFKENKVEEKVEFKKSEVFYNKKNTPLFEEKAKKCGISKSEMGVPLLWNSEEQKCYTGDKDIIDFFKQEIEKTNEN